MKYKEALTKELLGELSSQGTLLNVPKNTQIVSIGDPIKDIPFLVSGNIRVYIESYETGKEVLLYYLENGETCFMSVIAGLGDEISKVSAVTESDCVINAVPNEMVKKWQGEHPMWNRFIIDLLVSNYSNSIQTIEELSFLNIETRLLNYLMKHQFENDRVKLSKTHLQIAQDLGTSREVVSRVLKKLQYTPEVQELFR